MLFGKATEEGRQPSEVQVLFLCGQQAPDIEVLMNKLKRLNHRTGRGKHKTDTAVYGLPDIALRLARIF